jgi:hypothetical protein
MVKFSVGFLVLFLNSNIIAANVLDSIPAKKQDVESIDAIIKALYDVVSGPKDEKRNWDRMRTLFKPEAAMIPIGKGKDSGNYSRYISVEDYIKLIGPSLENKGFFEKEIQRKTEQFGDMAHVWSTYESKNKKEDLVPFIKGINSIQLWNDSKRWWIMNIMWQSETSGNKIK